MSEYWKSTPKAWCKYCKAYIRDTKLERQQHDATPRHQGNLKRFLRDLHRDSEREARDKDRAKQEVERLNGVVAGSSSTGTSSAAAAPWKRSGALPTPAQQPPPRRQPTAEERKRQLGQLADMGVAVPHEYRGEMAMAGDWQTISERSLSSIADDKSTKSAIPRVVSRKRKLGDGGDPEAAEEEEEEADENVQGALEKRREGWGSRLKTYPGRAGQSLDDADDDDLDALLSSSTARTKAQPGTQLADDAAELDPSVKVEDPAEPPGEGTPDTAAEKVKHEKGETAPMADTKGMADKVEPKPDSETGVMFKKRKAKPIRQR